MNALQVKEEIKPFNLIPAIQKKAFIKKVLEWYQHFPENKLPGIYSDAIYMCKHTQDNYYDYMGDLHRYHYAMKHMYERLPSEDIFPIPYETFDDDERFGVVESDWINNQWLLEMALYKDITKVLDYYHMFYVKDITKEPSFIKEEISIHNMPIKGVW